MLTLFKSYSDVLKRRYGHDFNQIIQDDTYVPMTVQTNEELEYVRSVALCGLEGDITPLPQNLPFSRLYPLCCDNIRMFVEEYYMFSDEYVQSYNDVDEILRKVSSFRNF